MAKATQQYFKATDTKAGVRLEFVSRTLNRREHFNLGVVPNPPTLPLDQEVSALITGHTELSGRVS